MSTYHVEWVIDIEANSSREAAEKALAIQRDVFSTATVFNVITEDDDEWTTVDLEVEEEDPS